MSLVVVTGAGNGIGRATARRFAHKGSTVIVADINETGGQETVDMIKADGGSAMFRHLDVADRVEWETFIAWVCAQYGVPNVVVNNAGILISGGFLDSTSDDWRRMIDINLMSPMLGSRLFVERMVDAGVRGHIVNLSSVGAFLPLAVAPAYVTAKAGVWLGSQALRAEFKGKGIGVSAICPGIIKTGLFLNGTRSGFSEEESAQWSLNLATAQRMLAHSPDTVARAIEVAVRFNLATVPVGPEAWLTWYASRLSPALVNNLVGLVGMSLTDRALALSGKVLGGAR